MKGKDTVSNFKCIHCGKVYSSMRGICSHITQAHRKKFKHYDFQLTNEEALPLVYGKSRSKEALAAEAEIDHLTPNFECVHCGKVFSSATSIAAHIRSAHQKQFESTDYERTAKEALPTRDQLRDKSNKTNETKGQTE